MERQIPMFMLHPPSQALPANAQVHVRLRWQRGLLGLPVLTPKLVIGPRQRR